MKTKNFKKTDQKLSKAEGKKSSFCLILEVYPSLTSNCVIV